MKLKNINQNQSFIINLKFLQTKHYFFYYLNFKNIQCKFVKSLKIIHKYNFYNKKIVFLNVYSIIPVVLKYLVKKTKHVCINNFKLLLNKFDFKSKLIVLLNIKLNWQFKIPSIWVTGYLNNYNFEINYKIIENFLFNKHKHMFFYIFLRSVLKKVNKY